MYNFIDVTGVSERVLPSEALKINGEYIENLISGYRTLTVSGREALSPELDYFETGAADGSKIKSKRYPARIITVKYQLLAKSNEEFREAYNKLASILDVKDAELIFEDETDKYFIGTPLSIGGVNPGTNSVIGEFEILCADPFKYSVVEYEVAPNVEDGSILIDYQGTYKAYPILQAEFSEENEASTDGATVTQLTGGGECGFVAFFNEREKIIQLGDAKEKDEATYPESQTLINHKFENTGSWGAAAKNLWAEDNGVSMPSMTQNGNIGMLVASYTGGVTDTSGDLLKNARSEKSKPVFRYDLSATTTDRTTNTVKVKITINTKMTKAANFFGKGYGLKGSVYIGGSWNEIELKSDDVRWEGNSGHIKNLTVTVSNLDRSQTKLTNIKFKVERTDKNGEAGILESTNCADLPISAYSEKTPDTYYLGATNYGSGTGWHSATISRTLKADKAGEIGAKNFTFSYRQKMSIGSGDKAIYQKGAFQAMLSNASGKVIAGVRILKNKEGKTAEFNFYVNGSLVDTFEKDLSYSNQYFGNGNTVKTSSIVKTGKKIEFNIGGFKKSYNNQAVKNELVTNVTFAFEQYGSNTALAYNGLYWAKFVKDNCDTWEDIPNKFKSNDVVEADCKSGKIFLNGTEEANYGALGNDWEEFYLKPGLNQFGFAYSEWATSAPTFKIRYREAFL